jgi:hypothetical protein
MVDDGRIFVGLALLGTVLAGVAAHAIEEARGRDTILGLWGDTPLRGPVSPELLAERERRLRRLERLIPVIDGDRAVYP